MKCRSCKKKSVISDRSKDNFIDYFEDKVKTTIKKYNLINKTDKVAVAVSGGKDSLSVMYILKKSGYNISGIAVNEGIKDYRENTLKNLQDFSEKHKIKIRIISFEEEFGFTLDYAVKRIKENPCNVCGVLRKYILNKYSKGYDVIATGHNMDDEAQAIMMNTFKAQPQLLPRLGPVAGLKISKNFTKRVKPLYFLKDEEIKSYVILKGFKVDYSGCKYLNQSFRASVKSQLNDYEKKKSGTKLNIINSFLSQLPKLKKKYSTANKINVCKRCGQPSSKDICMVCQFIEKISKK